MNIEFCNAKLKYDTEHANETFEWEHVIKTDRISTTKPIGIHAKNKIGLPPKRGVIVSRRNRKKRHKLKPYDLLRMKKERLFHSSYPLYKGAAAAYNG